MLKRTDLTQRDASRSANDIARELVVRLIEPIPRAPVTPVEQSAVASLKDKGVVDMDHLVKRVASDLYYEEIRNGASVLDIGLFGRKLFISGVAAEIQKGDGNLWRIQKGIT